MVPALLATGLATFWIVREVVKGRPPLTEKVAKRLRLSLLVTFITLHPTLTTLVFRFFHCSNDIAGRTLLRADASIVCWSPDHFDAIWNTAMPAIVIYVIGIPATLLFLLVSNRNVLEDTETKKYLGFAYANYRSGMYFW